MELLTSQSMMILNLAQLGITEARDDVVSVEGQHSVL